MNYCYKCVHYAGYSPWCGNMCKCPELRPVSEGNRGRSRHRIVLCDFINPRNDCDHYKEPPALIKFLKFWIKWDK